MASVVVPPSSLSLKRKQSFPPWMKSPIASTVALTQGSCALLHKQMSKTSTLSSLLVNAVVMLGDNSPPVMGPILVVGVLLVVVVVVVVTLRRHLCCCWRHSQLRLALHCCFLVIRRQPLARRHCPFCHTQSDRCLHFPLRNKLLQLPWRSLVLSSDESTPVFRWMHYQCKHEIIIIKQEITETRIHKLTSCSRHGHNANTIIM